MTIQKKILSIFMIVTFAFVSITGFYFNTYVMAASLTDYGDLFTTFTRLVGANDDVPLNVLDELVFDAICPRDSGFIVRTTGRVNYELTKKAIATYLNHKYSNQDKTKDNITQSDINEFSQDFYQNVSYNDNSNTTTYNDNSKSMINLCINEVINDSPVYYAYTSQLNSFINNFGSGDQYNAFRKFLVENPDKLVTVPTTDGLTNLTKFYSIDYSGDVGFVGGTIYPNDNLIWGPDIRSISTWDSITYTVFVWDENTSSYIEGSYDIFGWYSFRIDPNLSLIPGRGIAGAITLSTQQILMFRTLEDLKSISVGELPYYINNTVYNDWSQSSGDYIVTNDNSNNVSYGDIISYVDSFNSETGNYPTSEDIQIFIENKQNENNGSGGEGGEGGQGGQGGSSNATATANNEGINVNVYNNHTINIGGGGSVSGNGTVSGNDIQDGGGVGNIFSFLSQIGDVLGSLIKNVGHVLAELVSGISETISALLEGIPTVFGDFMGALLGWLPEELRALITLGISAMIIVGVIKLFRG